MDAKHLHKAPTFSKAIGVLTIFLYLLVPLKLEAENGYGFSGQAFDSSGSVFLRARYYDPETGAFLSKDPLGIQDGINQYTYCGNDSINNSDSSGLVIGVDDLIILGALGAIAGLHILAIHDVATKEVSSGGAYASVALGGFVAGPLAPEVGAIGAGLAMGATANISQQTINVISGDQQGKCQSSLFTLLADGEGEAVCLKFKSRSVLIYDNTIN